MRVNKSWTPLDFSQTDSIVYRILIIKINVTTEQTIKAAGVR